MGTFGEKSFVYINITQKELTDTFETRIYGFTGPIDHSKSGYLKGWNDLLLSQHKSCWKTILLRIEKTEH